MNSRQTSSLRNARVAGDAPTSSPTAFHTVRGDRVPNFRSAESRLVPARSSRLRWASYARAAPPRNTRSLSRAAVSPPGSTRGLGVIPRDSQVGMGTVAAVTPSGNGGRLSGAGSGRSIAAVPAKARANGVNTV